MATAKKSANKPASKTSSSHSTRSADQQDAIALLTADHKEVKALFTKYDKLVKDEAEDDVKADLAEQICMMLTVHATVEEELFYPAAREAIDEPDLIDEADVEHATAKDLIAQIQAASLGEELYDAKVKVLGEYIAHHVKEEEGEIFPKVKKAKMDLKALGEEMSARKEELTSQMAAEIDRATREGERRAPTTVRMSSRSAASTGPLDVSPPRAPGWKWALGGATASQHYGAAVWTSSTCSTSLIPRRSPRLRPARCALRLKLRLSKRGVPTVYANDNYGAMAGNGS